MRWSSLPELAVPTLTVVAEAAWISVVYLALQAGLAREAPVIGMVELSVVVAIGMIAIRRGALDPTGSPLLFLAALAAAGAAGWLVAEAPRGALLERGLIDALGMHPGGWLAVLALWRGAVRPYPERDDRGLSGLVLVGVPLLAVPWLIGGIAPEPLQTTFVSGAFAASLTFVSAGFMAAGLARLQTIGTETGLDWRTDRSWLGLVGGVLLLVVVVALPVALMLDLPIHTVLFAVLGPLAVILAAVAWIVAYPLGFLIGSLVEFIRGLGWRLPPPVEEFVSGRTRVSEEAAEQIQLGLVVIGLFWALMALLALIVLRRWLRSRERDAGPRRADDRRIVLPQQRLRLPRPRLGLPRRRRRPVASDGVTAYLAALDEFEHADTTLGRGEAETPAGHARRLRRAGAGQLALELLAADYELVRYAGRRLSPAEDRRAIGRWRRIRDALRRRRDR